MKKILGLLILSLYTINGEPIWGLFPKFHEILRPWTKLGPQRHDSSGHSNAPPENQCAENNPILASCRLLERFFSNKNDQPTNQMNANCKAAWICPNPETGDTIITDADGRTMKINPNMDPRNTHNANCNNQYPTNGGNTDQRNEQFSTQTTNIPETQTRPNDPSGKYQEGLIDVRIAAN